MTEDALQMTIDEAFVVLDRPWTEERFADTATAFDWGMIEAEMGKLREPSFVAKRVRP